MNERERALLLLRRIESESLYASRLLHHETGFVRTLVLGVLRWRSRLDQVIAAATGRAIGKLDRAVVEILRIGVYQLLYMDVARYAAVSETVDLASRYAKRARGLVNAALRKAAQGVVPPDSVATATAHPEWLLARWTKQFGAERARRIAEANQELSYPDVMVLGGEPPAGAEPSRMVEGMYRLHGPVEGANVYALDEGSGVIASMAAAAGKEVLDLAAAPGGKTIVMQRRGARVISNDLSLARLLPLRRHSSKLVVSDGRAPAMARQFQTVLLDAPCSATGTFRKNPEIKWRLRESDLPSFASLQRELLASALTLARETVVYSTCSLEREENDDVVAAVLSDAKDFVAVDATPFLPSGVKEWVENGVLRLTPESGADGFTAFVLQRVTHAS